jgi:hypothetical protein
VGKGWSTELETLDQLLGDEMPLRVIRQLYSDSVQFERSLVCLLAAGEVQLVNSIGTVVPAWQWREVLAAEPPLEMTVRITIAGVQRVG